MKYKKLKIHSTKNEEKENKNVYKYKIMEKRRNNALSIPTAFSVGFPPNVQKIKITFIFGINHRIFNTKSFLFSSEMAKLTKTFIAEFKKQVLSIPKEINS